MVKKLFKDIDLDEIEKQIKFIQIPYDYDTKEYPIEVLIHKYNQLNKETGEKMMFIPDYQRQYVWKDAMASRFIESLLMGVPIQPLFASVLDESGRLEVIDGSQRLKTIDRFLKDELKLKELKKLPLLNGLRFSDLAISRQEKFKIIDIRLHVISEKADWRIRADIFDRINTSGVKAEFSQIRKGALQGIFYDFILECAKHHKFLKLCPISSNALKFDEAEELVLRFFAYSDIYLQAKQEVYKTLDKYVYDNNMGFNKEKKLSHFNSMLDFVESHFILGFAKTPNAKSTPRVRFEAIAVGTHLALEINPLLKPVYMEWLNSDEFHEHTTSDSSNNPGRLIGRVEFVRDCLLNVIQKKDLHFDEFNKLDISNKKNTLFDANGN